MSTQSSTETVSQSEVEALLAQLGGGDVAGVDVVGAAQASEFDRDLTPRHEFPQLSFFSSSELRKLRLRHESFISTVAGRLSVHLGLEVKLQMSKLETLSFQKFTEGLSNPTHLTLVKVEPLAGTCLVDIPPHLGLCIVDRELGGPAICLDEPRDLCKMEARLLARVTEIMLSEWCSAWSDLHDLRPVLLKYESNGRFLQTCSPETTMLVLGIGIQIGEVSDQIHFAFPHFTMAPLMAKLRASSEGDAQPDSGLLLKKLRWNSVFDDVPIHIRAELPEVLTTARQLSGLKPGDVIRLSSQMATQVRVCLASAPKLVGNLGSSGGMRAVKICEVLKD